MSKERIKPMIRKLAKMREDSKQFKDQKRRILSLRMFGRMPKKTDKLNEDEENGRN
jgi:predicted DNA binding CopG/RHH family protein